MLKCLAIFAIAAFAAVGVPSQPHQAPNPDQQIGKTEPVHPVRSFAAQTPPEQNSKPATDKNATDTGSPAGNTSVERSHWWSSSEWWLVIVGFGTLIVVGWQTVILGKSVAVAQKSAETTSKQVALYANAERARITMEVTDFKERSFRIRGKNTGRTVAEITLARGYTLILPRGQPLPPSPLYLSGLDTYGDFVEFTAPNEFIEPIPDSEGYTYWTDLSSDEICIAIRDKRSALWAFGRICYKDGISPKLRETRFCYEVTVSETMETDLVMSGPVAYRVAT